MYDICKKVALGVAAVTVAGCTFPMQPAEQYPGFGDAVTHDMAVHIVDPAPAGAENTSIELHGARADGLMERYESGTVFDPEAVEVGEE